MLHLIIVINVIEAAWGEAEVEINKNTEELGNLGLTPEEEADIDAFSCHTQTSFFMA